MEYFYEQFKKFLNNLADFIISMLGHTGRQGFPLVIFIMLLVLFIMMLHI
jgi:hypothetical protein